MRRFMALMIAVVILLPCIAVTAEEGEVSVFINSMQVIFPDAQPIIQEGRTLVPLRAVFEGLGADVYWNDAEQIVCIAKSETKILLKIGEEIFFRYVCGDFDEILWAAIVSPEYLDDMVGVLFFDVAPQIIDERTYIPLRFVCEAMGVDVDWEEEALEVLVNCSEEYISESNTDKTFAEKFFEYTSAPEDYEDEFKEGMGDLELSNLEIDTSIHYFAKIEMDSGDIMMVELMPEYAPETVQNFIKLVNEGFYNGITFHRIVKDFMIQGGDPQGTGMGGSGETIRGEFASNGFARNTLPHERGVISMARSGDPNSASSQFFICHGDSSFLDGSYAAFGKLVEGFDVLDKLAGVEIAAGSDAPVNPPVIQSITMIEE